ncbi:hypothetical protein JTB14_027388 [Gonioctena quinquepunctata]|nr:hypothetical protein JTB14_027388 [Gonioctena quinquepunctata]
MTAIRLGKFQRFQNTFAFFLKVASEGDGSKIEISLSQIFQIYWHKCVYVAMGYAERKRYGSLFENTTESEDVLDDTMDENMIATDTPITTDAASTNAKPIDEAFSTTIKDTLKKSKTNVTSKILTAIQKGSEERTALMSHLTPTPSEEDEIDILFKSLAN